jgi:hypothetical protein
MSIDINLTTQEERKSKKLFLFLGILMFAWISTALFFPYSSFSRWAWLPLLPNCIEAILYGLGKRGLFINNFPYLRIDDNRIESFGGGFLTKPKSVKWADTIHMEIKLFELIVTTTNEMKVSFDLTGLTDDNLKLVKDILVSLKHQKGL